jgi:hypothetical protein
VSVERSLGRFLGWSLDEQYLVAKTGGARMRRASSQNKDILVQEREKKYSMDKDNWPGS